MAYSVNRLSFLSSSLAAAVAGLLPGGPAFAAEHAGESVPPEEALHRLIIGNEKFVDDNVPAVTNVEQRRELLVQGQHPFASVLACADSRIIPNLIFAQGLGDLFVVRVAGNYPDDLVTASLEYAVEHLGTRLIMVLGHQNCGAVQAAYDALKSGKALPPHLSVIERLMSPGIAGIVKSKGSLNAAVRANVKAAETALESSKGIIEKKVSEGYVKVVGAVYHLGSGAATLVS